MEPKLKDVVVELTAEAPLVGVLPLAVDDLERDGLVGRPGGELEQRKVPVVAAGDELILRCFGLVDEVWVEDVELVALDDLGRGVVHVVVGLVVFVPLEAGVDAVEVSRFARPVLV